MTGWAVGDRVVALQERQDLPTLGQAERAVAPAWALAAAPTEATMAQASTLPLNGTTADQALDLLGPSPGRWRWLLITGAVSSPGFGGRPRRPGPGPRWSGAGGG